MFASRVRSFPTTLLLAAALLLSFALVAASAERERGDRNRGEERSARSQQESRQAAPQTQPQASPRSAPGQQRQAPETSAPRGQSPQPAPGSAVRTAPSVQASPGRAADSSRSRSDWRWQRSSPAQPRTDSSAGPRERGDAGRTSPDRNPYARYRSEPRAQEAQPQTNRSAAPRDRGEAGRSSSERNPYLRYRAEPRAQEAQPERTRPSARPRMEQPAAGEGQRATTPRRVERPTPQTQPRTAGGPAPRERAPGRERVQEGNAPRDRERDQSQGQARERPRDESQGQPADRNRDQSQGRAQPRDGAVTTPERRRDQEQAPARRRWGSPEERSGDRGRQTAPDRRGEPQAQGPQGRRQAGRMQVPEASFRGPEADRRVREVPAERQARVRGDLTDQVRQWNRVQPTFRGGRPERDVVGNLVPRDARMLQRSRLERVSVSSTRIEAQFGRPANYYVFMPRYPSDYWDGYWDGYRDGRWDGHRFVPHRPAVVVNFYYGFYYSDPLWFGFYYPGYYPSVYHYWGYCPGWVYPNRVYVYPSDYAYVPATPYRYYGSYSVDYRGADAAINDIRAAWLDSDAGRLSRHLTDELDVQVYFDGEYEYTTSTDDYYGMTADAMATTSAIAMDFDDPIFISSAEVFYTGRHVFYDPDGHRQTVYVSYRMRRLGRDWYLVAVGSSLNPIEHHYRDFRYH